MCWAVQVHALHVALRGAGFTCAEDDLRWWQFGDSTESVLQGFQVQHPVPFAVAASFQDWEQGPVVAHGGPAQCGVLKMTICLVFL